MKVRALPKFEGLLDLERTKLEGKEVYPKAGDVWETSEERALYLKNNGVVEIVENKKEEKVEEIVLEPITEISNESQRKPKEEKKSQRTKKSKK